MNSKMPAQVQNRWLDIFHVPHIRSAVFQHLYHSDIQRYMDIDDYFDGTCVEDSSFVDFGDDAFRFCKAANINIYKEKVKLLNTLQKEKQRIDPKALEAKKFIDQYYQARNDDP